MYAEYIKEREGFDIIETSAGFAVYKVTGEEIYLRDIYVRAECRKRGIASDLADEVAKIGQKAGCRYLVGSVSPQSKTATENIEVLIRYGMTLHKCDSSLMVFFKEI